ncbi:flagellar basal-body rod modification protein FlgD [Clostridium acidisoli DSM 12555]|jgi:flagellar basal-body rod modification protein FlgD|uniref:Flagellar basal-body rod modification protein FlgD n=1 Tax=Clostridium acidisoli DSM 12555 TaxID=1121291 RepID=A0A1W1X1S0_9CLOT|nr:flagellar hook capping FlgD N-terminal domain-containing protein [Clostridium acidisoli]SMC17854.1 flagellar basal-body rod modification protein FlgD [Clostridium acidisoli DSM 12555]
MSTSGVDPTSYTSMDPTNTSKASTTKSNSLDKNAFMKILMAEVSNQDPTSQNNDPTQYISQLAQFSSLEQMTNLNNTMTLTSALNLIGATVQLNQTDSSGNYISGVVKSVSKNGDDITLNMQVDGSSTLQNYDYSNVIGVSPTSSTK